MPVIRSSCLIVGLVLCASLMRGCKAKSLAAAPTADASSDELRSGLSLFGLRSETVPLRCSCVDLVSLSARPEYPRATRRSEELECAYAPSGSATTRGQLSVRVAKISDAAAFDEAVGEALSSRVKALSSNRYEVDGGEAYVALVTSSGGVERVSVLHLREQGLVVTTEEPANASDARESANSTPRPPAYTFSLAANAGKACR